MQLVRDLIRQVRCLVFGDHEYLWQTSRSRVWCRCMHCGRLTPGITVAARSSGD